jgi:hypothetical protein
MTAGRAAAQAVDFGVTGVFNSDPIVNTDPDPPTPFDEDNDPLGPSFSFLTESAAVAAGCPTPGGLPDDGFFPANADHPDVHLSCSDQSSFQNARRSNGPETYTIIPPANHYSNVHVFFTSSSGTSVAMVTMDYVPATGTTTSFFIVPGWFDPALPPAYSLFDGGDRIPPNEPFVCDDANTVAIFGFNLPADPTRILTRVDIARTDTAGVGQVFFGATGVLFVPVELQAFTVE